MTGELAERVAEHINHSRLHAAMLYQDPEDVIETVLEALGAEQDDWRMKAEVNAKVADRLGRMLEAAEAEREALSARLQAVRDWATADHGGVKRPIDIWPGLAAALAPLDASLGTPGDEKPPELPVEPLSNESVERVWADTIRQVAASDGSYTVEIGGVVITRAGAEKAWPAPTLDWMQETQPWTAPYSRAFEASKRGHGGFSPHDAECDPEPHRSLMRDLMHVTKAVGVLASIAEWADHGSVRTERVDQAEYEGRIADLVMCALHMANNPPRGYEKFALQRAVIERVERVNNVTWSPVESSGSTAPKGGA